MNLFDAARIAKSKIDADDILKTGRICGLLGSAKPLFMAVLSENFKNTLVVTSTTEEAEKIFDDIRYFLDGSAAELYLLETQEAAGRIPALRTLSSDKKTVVIASLNAALKETYSPEGLKQASITIREKMGHKIDELAQRFFDAGFIRQTMVEASGEMAVRGGIVDIFPLEGNPLRIEFDGDTISSIRNFEALTQRSTQRIKEFEILPAGEKGISNAFDYCIGEDCAIFADEPDTFNEKQAKVKKKISLSFYALGAKEKCVRVESMVPENYALRSEKFIADIQGTKNKVFIVTNQDERINELLQELPPKKDAISVVRGQISGGFILPDIALTVYSDKEIYGEKYFQRKFKVPKEETPSQNLYIDYEEGDFVVHKDHGIGIYQGIEAHTFEGITSDYLFIQYLGNDKLYVPVHQMHKVLKYRSAGEYTPKLNTLGGSDWQIARKKAKASAKKLTEDLLEIYNARNSRIGFSYPVDNVWQKEFESAFPYDETPDQTESVKAVKMDMESERPMDRLLCGDVGFGKTEVALRAAFKAVCSGKQVALLVPTTVLAEQHFLTFSSRFAPFPFKVDMLSRFRNLLEQKSTVKDIEAGVTDVVIGTHRLLSKDIKFKDLGLLIIDEEHKFGVSHKERLKNLKRSLDCLSMSATPIPRTLYMSLSDIWNISMIETPPPGRSSIATYVLPWDKKTLGEAVMSEIDRGGQVFYVHNRVDSIFSEAEKLKRILPGLRIAVAHGQMRGQELERIMIDFVEKKYDVLVCTSIIESGLDIPNVNTIIIDNPSRFGLSTLYQLRGRVGRSNIKAYCYLLYSDSSQLSGTALERLSAIRSFTDLGSGYKIAMRDLEIRGAGEVLGARQSGHMASVGFDIYCEMLKDAGERARGIKVHKEKEIKIDLPLDAYIPAQYVSDEGERISFYKRMNLARSGEEVADIKEEMADRFGKIPQQALDLFKLIDVRIKASENGIRSIIAKKGFLVIDRWDSKQSYDISSISGKELFLIVEKHLKS